MSELPKRAEDKVNTFGIVLIGISAAILLWATIILLQAYYDHTAGDLERRRDAMYKSSDVRNLRAKQKASLQDLTRRKVKVGDVEKELVTIPIDVAMELTLKDLEADPEASLVPALGPQNKATVPAEPGKPPDDAKPPEETEETEGETPEEGTPTDQEADERGATDEEETTGLDETLPEPEAPARPHAGRGHTGARPEGAKPAGAKPPKGAKPAGAKPPKGDDHAPAEGSSKPTDKDQP